MFISFDENDKNVVDSLKGYEGEIVKIIAKIYNFTLDIIDCNSDWGFKLDNGTWTGIVANVMNMVNRLSVKYL